MQDKSTITLSITDSERFITLLTLEAIAQEDNTTRLLVNYDKSISKEGAIDLLVAMKTQIEFAIEETKK